MDTVKEFDVPLSVPIEISDGNGQMATVDSVLLIGPSRKNAKAASGLKRLVHRSISSSDTEASDDDKRKAKEEREKNKGKPIRELFPPADVINVVAASSLDGNTLDEMNGFITSLLSDGCCKMNGSNAKQGDLNKINMDDWEKISGEYVSNFLLNSLFAS